MATAAVKVIGVVGSGQMGSGIAQVAAHAGFDVWLHDSDPVALNRAEKAIAASVRHLVSKGQLSQVIALPISSSSFFFLNKRIFLTRIWSED